MRFKAALVTASILAWATSAQADPLHSEAGACNTDARDAAYQTTCPPQAQAPTEVQHVLILTPAPAMLGDITGARGPDPNARELREIAVAAAIGNDEKVLIASRSLHKFGVSREAVQEAISQVQLHTGSLRAANRRFFVLEGDRRPDPEQGWENSQ
jgi:alkylhydroperoxidase/carboxymuconolactone decarboxylase family protein YurZ